MLSEPTPTVRRAMIAMVWLAAVAAGLLAAVWAIGWAVEGGPPPGAATVAEATGLDLPEGTEVLEADLSQMQTPTPGDRAELTLDIPSEAFGDFLADNGMDTPLLAGTTPAGQASGIIPSGCGTESCWSATIIVKDASVTVRLQITLL